MDKLRRTAKHSEALDDIKKKTTSEAVPLKSVLKRNNFGMSKISKSSKTHKQVGVSAIDIQTGFKLRTIE